MNSTLKSPGTQAKGLARFWRILVEPSKAIQKPDERRKIRLLTTFIVLLFFLFIGVNLGYYFFIPGYGLPPADLVGYTFLLITYILSRTRYATLATILVMAMFPINIFGNLIGGTSVNPSITLVFLLPSYVLSSMWFSAGGVTAYSLITLVGIIFLPFLAPTTIHNFSDVVGAFSVNTIGAVLVVVAMTHRNRMEHDRQTELRIAYDTTLEGWARALELRDKETEGHCQRVTELTLKLASEVGIHGEELDHIRRGALLHDIGKMGTPDSILQKPGPLTPEEFEIIKDHVTQAYKLLAPIPFLAQALMVPYCHHEKWDGTGYPRGLKGENIPLAARIFSIVDVWDALLSDRHYRKAWSREKALAYIKEQGGKHFDPKVVEAFLKIVL